MRNHQAPSRRLAIVLAFFAVLAIGARFAFGRRDERVPIGRELVFDDFGFTVEGRSGSPAADAQSEHKLVRLRVANHAVRVPYVLASHKAKLIDADGREYPATSAIVWGGKAPKIELAPGESCVQELTFVVPRDARDLHLKISWGAFGDRLDELLIGEKTFAIE